MSIILQESDTTQTTSTFTQACENVTVNGISPPGTCTGALRLVSSQVSSAGTATNNITVGLNTDGFERLAHFISGGTEPNSPSWESGNYTVRLEVTTSNMNLTGLGVHIIRLNSGGAFQADIAPGSSAGAGVSLGDFTSTGVKSVTTSGSSQTASTSDRLLFAFFVTNSSSMSTQTAAWKASQQLDTPLTQNGPTLHYQPVRIMSQAVQRAVVR